MKAVSENVELKRMVGTAAADYIANDMTVGIGTGSTVAFLIEELGRRVRQGLFIRALPTSLQSRMLCIKHNIPLIDDFQLDRLDIAIDGADQIDSNLNAIKGGGGAHTIEKIIGCMADKYILIADHYKFVPRLGKGFPIPIEVIPQGLKLVHRHIRDLGGDLQLRQAVKKDGPVITDNGNFIADIRFDQFPVDIVTLNSQLTLIPGLVETGLFLNMANMAIKGSEGNVELVYPQSME